MPWSVGEHMHAFLAGKHLGELLGPRAHVRSTLVQAAKSFLKEVRPTHIPTSNI